MPKVRSAADSAAKWARVAPTRVEDYTQGVKDPSVDWAGATKAAGDAYEAGINESIGTKRFQRGVEAAGNQRWARKVADQGVQRWAPGVRAAQSDYETGMAPVIATIERVQLPPRGPRGDERNMQRSAILAKALSEMRRRG